MATARPFAYNTGTGITGTTQVGDLAVGTSVAFGAGGNAHDYWGGLPGGQEFGYLANLYLYDRKLTATEITQNYTSLVGRFV